MESPSVSEALANLRLEIDRIDSGLHQLLIKRGEIIDRLIEAKARQGGGCAFRPEREADMMRRLVARHQGLLPLDTVESIWRIIISTFTFVQSPYSVNADISGGDAPMRDCCRFHFGFTVPYAPRRDAGAVIRAVAESNGDLGLVRVTSGSGPWWRALTAQQAPKIIARLPFVERPDHPAGLPLFVIAQPLADAAAREVVIHALTLERQIDHPRARLTGLGAEMLDSYTDGSQIFILAAAPREADLEGLREGLKLAGAGETEVAEIGGHAARFDLARSGDAPENRPFEAPERETMAARAARADAQRQAAQ
ncbi:chorismate mutase [Methylocapsa palsarum]|uniref:chorismate mutase n=1 Tax=Methylocapsa palsarum TaxID=1612308 RepID=A0A1I4AF44_9HYPH|nr:chorismate mutase [Methylocapsa palsarum]SFK55038.1 Chorismate mutase [Methylocapsa palsarum]